ncbi:MAG: LuxR family transcriptional regulator [Chloroflexi bacterium]|nr:LuxR family transcriptional regulator [Chloroflexota bacterium]
MTISKLGGLLNLLEASSGAMSIRELARELDTSQDRVESMLDYWVRKGKITVSATHTDCGSCGVKGDCSFVLEMPRVYELVAEES